MFQQFKVLADRGMFQPAITELYNNGTSSVTQPNSTLPGIPTNSTSNIETIAKATFLILIFIVSSLGNFLVLYLIAKFYQLRTVTNAFVGSLSASALLQTWTCIPMTLVTLIKDEWIFGRSGCIINGFLNLFFSIASTLTLTFIAVDRYYAVVRQPRQRINKQVATLSLTLIWLQALLFAFPWYIAMPNILGQPSLYKSGYLHCMYIFHTRTSYLSPAFSVSVVCACFILPFALMCFCYFGIWRTLRATDVRIRPATTDTNFMRFCGEVRTANTVLIMIFLFICCWGPYCIMGIVVAISGSPFTVTMDTVAMWLGWSNCASNPVIYAMRNPHVGQFVGRSREAGYLSRSFTSIQPTPTIARHNMPAVGGADRHRDSLATLDTADINWASTVPGMFLCGVQRKSISTISTRSERTNSTSV